MVFPPQRPQVAVPEQIPEDQNVIAREAQKIRAREMLNKLAERIGGVGTRVRDANLFTQFLAQMDSQAKAQGGSGIEQTVASDPRTRELAPQMAPQGLSREELIAQADARMATEQSRLAPVVAQPPGVDPGRLLEAAGAAAFPEATLLGAGLGAAGQRIAGESGRRFGEYAGFTVGPGAAIGGVRGAIQSALLSGTGAAVGGQVAGPTGEVIGGVAAPLSPTAIRLGVRGAGAAARGVTRGADEAAFRLQGQQVAHAATQPPQPPAGGPPGVPPPGGVPPQGQIATQAAPPAPPRIPPIAGPGAGAFGGQGSARVYDNILDLQPIRFGLDRTQRIKNAILSPFPRAVFDDALATPAMRERNRIQPIIRSQANGLAARNVPKLRSVFQLDNNGQVQSLTGIDPSLSTSVAQAAPPGFPPPAGGTPLQPGAVQSALPTNEVTPRVLTGDVIDRRVSLPGQAPAPAAGQPLAPTIQDIAARYPIYEPHLTPAQRKVMTELRDEMAKWREALDMTGASEQLGVRPDVMEGGFYVPRGNAIEGGIDDPVRLGRGSGKTPFERPALFSSQAEGIAKGFVYAPLEDALRGYGVQAGRRATDQHVVNYFRSLTSPSGQPLGKAIDNPLDRTAGVINMRGLENYEYPIHVSNAANKVLNAEEAGRLRQQLGLSFTKEGGLNAIIAFNRLFRGITGNLDDSVIGIQGTLVLGKNPEVFRKGMAVNLASWADPERLGKALVEFDRASTTSGLANSTDWSKWGVQVAGLDPEFRIGTHGIAEVIGNLPGFKAGQRVFGNTRTMWALEMARTTERSEIARLGRALTPDEYREIGGMANRMVGVQPRGNIDDPLDFLLYAPGWLQARIGTVVDAGRGLLPGAGVKQRVLRDAFFRYLGLASIATYTLNRIQGRETDFRPMVNGKPNSNFMRIRWANRDWSLLGPWDSLLRATILTATGKPHQALRSLGSGFVQAAWDYGTGTDAIGKGTRDNPENFATSIVGMFAPFSLESVPEIIQDTIRGVNRRDPEQIAGGVAGTAFEFVGGKQAPLSFRDRAEVLAKERYGVSYDSLVNGLRAARESNRSGQEKMFETRLDSIRSAIQKEQIASEGRRRTPITLAAKRDVFARELFRKPYNQLFESQRKNVDKRLSEFFVVGDGQDRTQTVPGARLIYR